MQLTVKDEVFLPGSQAERLAKILGWNRHRAIGMLCDLWHNSQAAEAVQGDQAKLSSWLTLRRPEDQVRVIQGLTQCGYLVDLGVVDGVNQWLIVGNRKHVDSKRRNAENQRLKALARWNKERAALSQNMPAADAYAVQSNAMQSNAMQFNAEREGEANPPAPPIELLEQANTEFEDRHEIQPPQASMPTPISPPPPPIPNTLHGATAELAPPDKALRVFEAYQSAREKHRQIPRALMANTTDLGHCKAIIALAAGDERVAIHVVRAYVKHDGHKAYWKTRKWPLWLIVEPRNFEEARTLAAEALAKG